MIPRLQPIFQGEWAPWGETLHLAPRWPATAVGLADWLCQPNALPDALRRYALRWGTGTRDLRAIASAWSMDYLWTLLPPVVAAATVLQHRFPVEAAQIALSLDDLGAPRGFHITNEGLPMPGTSTARRYSGLIDGHLRPLFAALHRHTGLAEKVLWSNAARYLGEILDEAQEHLPGPPPTVRADRDQLLGHAGRQPGDGLRRPRWDAEGCDAPLGPTALEPWPTNPMPALPRRTTCTQAGQIVPLHSHCCLYYLLPSQAYCGGCPLAPQHRGRVRTTASSV
jgi:ferric iron reductase protein FhuF